MHSTPSALAREITKAETTMPYYRRWRSEGGIYFFTLVSHERRGVFAEDSAHTLLHNALNEARRRLPFDLDAMVLLPDHLHMLMRLPLGDDDVPSRIAKIKRNFTQAYLAAGGSEGTITESRRRQRYRGVWQKRYYEHCIRNYEDYKQHLDYIHANPVRHGLVERPLDWQWSSFQRYVITGEYDEQWCGHIELPGGANIEPDGW